MPVIRDKSGLTNPEFVEKNELMGNGTGEIHTFSGGGIVINSIDPVEIPMPDGSISVFDKNGNLTYVK